MLDEKTKGKTLRGVLCLFIHTRREAFYDCWTSVDDADKPQKANNNRIRPIGSHALSVALC